MKEIAELTQLKDKFESDVEDQKLKADGLSDKIKQLNVIVEQKNTALEEKTVEA